MCLLWAAQHLKPLVGLGCLSRMFWRRGSDLLSFSAKPVCSPFWALVFRRWGFARQGSPFISPLSEAEEQAWQIHIRSSCTWGAPLMAHGKESTCNAGDVGLIPGSWRFPGEGNRYPFQYSCLENPMDRGAWWAIVHGAAKSWTWLSH